MKKIFILILAIFGGRSVSYAQTDTANNKNSFTFSIIQGGRIISTFHNQLQGDFWGLQAGDEINMSRDSAAWVHSMNVKSMSIILSYLNMQSVSLNGISGSEGIIGSSVQITDRLNIYLFKTGNTTFEIDPGIGFAYISQTYHTNGNLIVASHINFVAQIGARAEVQVSNNFKLLCNLDVEHLSNASTHLPNDGINRAIGSIGIAYAISGTKGPSGRNQTFELNNKNSIDLSIGIGWRDYTRTGYFFFSNGTGAYLTPEQEKAEGTSDLYHISGYVGYNRRLNSVLGLKIGTDVTYYGHTFNQNTPDNFFRTYESSFSSYSHYTVGISGGFDIWLNKLAFSASYGQYVHANFLNPSIQNYWNFGAKYYLTNWIAVNATVHFHPQESGYVSFGVLFSVWR